MTNKIIIIFPQKKMFYENLFANRWNEPMNANKIVLRNLAPSQTSQCVKEQVAHCQSTLPFMAR